MIRGRINFEDIGDFVTWLPRSRKVKVNIPRVDLESQNIWGYYDWILIEQLPARHKFSNENVDIAKISIMRVAEWVCEGFLVQKIFFLQKFKAQPLSIKIFFENWVGSRTFRQDRTFHPCSSQKPSALWSSTLNSDHLHGFLKQIHFHLNFFHA